MEFLDMEKFTSILCLLFVCACPVLCQRATTQIISYALLNEIWVFTLILNEIWVFTLIF
jgi:hypothetical protein